MNNKMYIVIIFAAITFYHILDRRKDLLVANIFDGIIYSEVIETTAGPLVGRLVVDDKIGVTYYAYQGIPYAESPTGPLRFKPPIPKKPWTVILNATEVSKACFQYEFSKDKSEMSEDCLFLNVYVPEKLDVARAVLVVIHGEGYLFEPIMQKADHLGPHLFYVKHDVIVVTINFRLGALGYFCLDIEDATGNNQLKDILLALKWVEENIVSFGGVTNNITLIGFSSSAATVEYLMMSNKSKGMFQQAILISGSMLSYNVFGRYPKQTSLDLAEQLGIEDNDPSIILEKMKKIEAGDIVQADEDFIYNEERVLLRIPTRFLPHAEIDSTHAVFTKNPNTIFHKAPNSDIKVLMGVMEEEHFSLIPFANRFSIKHINNDIELLIPSDIEYPKYSKQSKELAKSIHEFYLSGYNLTLKNIRNLLMLNADAQFTYPIINLLDYYERSISKVYFYISNFVHDLNMFSVVMNVNSTIMGHADTAFYVINTQKLRSKYQNKDFRAMNMSQTLLSLTSNFIKFGNPTPTDFFEVKWPEYGNKKQFLEIGEHLKVKNYFSSKMKRRIKFWQNVYAKYDQYVKNGGATEPKVIA